MRKIVIAIISVILLLEISCDRTSGPNNQSTVTDIDGNVYKTVMIGDQIWMVENLQVTHYNNGDSIPKVTDSIAWVDLDTGAWCDYNNSIEVGAICGHLYNC